MADMRISELTTAAGLHDGDLFETSQTDSISSSGYASYKTSLSAIAAFIAKQVQFSGDLQTTSKTLIGAINEVFNAGTSVTVKNVLPATETTKRVATITVDGVAKDINADDTVKVITDLKTPKNATITNGIAQFACIEENLVKGLKVTMNPIQDLHGYSNPWAGGAGKNKLPFDIAELKANNTNGTWSGNSYDFRGVLYSCDNKGIWTVTGSATDTSYLRIFNDELSAGSYVLNGISGGSSSTYRLRYKIGSGSFVNMYDGDSATINVSTSDTVTIDLYISSGYQIPTGGITFEPMIRLSSVADSTFEPYENICPISGRTEVSVTRTVGEDVETKTHQYSETVYGGSDDFVNGKLDDDVELVTYTSSEYWAYNSSLKGFRKTYSIASTKYDNALMSDISVIKANTDIDPNFHIAQWKSGDNFYIDFVNTDTLGIEDATTWKALLTSLGGVNVAIKKNSATEIPTSAEEITTVSGTNIISGTEPISECQYTELATVDDLRKIIGGQ